MGVNSIQVRQINIELIKTALIKTGAGTKNSISKATGLSVASCRNILNYLLETGEVMEMDLADSTGGRPSRRFIYNLDYSYAALLYLRIEGFTKSVYTAIANMAGDYVYQKEYIRTEIKLEDIKQIMSSMQLLYPKIKVFSLGIPGIVKNGVVGPCDFRLLSNINLGHELSLEFNKQMIIENDVNSTALGYYHHHKETHLESIVYIYYPENGNAGAGIIINGKVLRGVSNFAGEVSNLPLGVNLEDQGQIQNDVSLFSELVVKTILSVNAVINPEIFILSGKAFSDKMKKIIVDKASDILMQNYPVKIQFEKDIHYNYLNGLKFLALKKMEYVFEIDIK